MKDIAVLFTAETIRVDSLGVMEALGHRINKIARLRQSLPPQPEPAVFVSTPRQASNWFIELASVPAEGRGTNILLNSLGSEDCSDGPIRYIHLVLLNGEVSVYQGFGDIAENLTGSDDKRRVIAHKGWRRLGFSR